VLNSVFRGEVHFGLAFDNLIDESVDRGFGRVGQKNRAGIAVGHIDVFQAVFFFVLAGKFMALDLAIPVFLGAAAAHQADLGAAFHYLFINVKTFCLVADQPALILKHFEVGDSLVVNSLIIKVNAWIKVNLWFVDVQKRAGVTLGQFTGFI